MSPENFAYWLTGFFELTEAKDLTIEQVAMIKEHLALCFNKVTKPLQAKTEITYCSSLPSTSPHLPNPYPTGCKLC